jgi:elongator complex protein 3
MPILQNTALIREVHVFGDQLSIGAIADGSGQHMGFGRRLIERAESIVREQYPTLTQIAVIAGVGVRPYFAKNGYTLKETYMVKPL